MPGHEDQQGSRKVCSSYSPYLPVKVLFLLGLDPTLLTLVHLEAKAELQPLAHNDDSGFCTSYAQKLEIEAKSGEPSPACRVFSVPLASEAKDELVGMQECPEQAALGPQGNWTLKGFSHTAVVQKALSAELA